MLPRRDRYLSSPARYLAAGLPVTVDQLRVRTMNFGQPWRTPGLEQVRYEATLPRAYVADLLRDELPEWIADSIAHPDPACALEGLLRARGWPDADAILADEDLFLAFARRFDHDLLLAWFGDGPAPADGAPVYVINTVQVTRCTPGDVTLCGVARTSTTPVRFQDA